MKFSPIWLAIISVATVAVVLSILHYFDLDDRLIELMQWMDTLGWEAGIWFMLVIAVAIVFLFPGVIFTMGAGFVFGVVKGTIYVVLGTTIGAGIAFLIARYLFGKRTSAWVMSKIKPDNLGEIVRNEGWRMIMLTRMVPLFPFKLTNYFFGLTPLKFRDFVIGTFLGVIPITVNNVYVGSIAADLASIGSERVERTATEWTLYGLGLLFAVIAIIGLTRMARRALKQKIDGGNL
ncbi:TVP38/TMEM64 family protein [Microbulbifer bruguierae]|uniref:TVP38/TMEM64 family membrane protein n=1 Tax=Microbulbifer bruguierae TaxID=3029061 RepID=A0ABY8NF02_9GAMM|nr:TVP38/TMEM64 family protein [Microbulbifer bruguierae]WGL17000.1 TVP38/TMEM64 family protein [Microbulbifer bruguierae]